MKLRGGYSHDRMQIPTWGKGRLTRREIKKRPFDFDGELAQGRECSPCKRGTSKRRGLLPRIVGGEGSVLFLGLLGGERSTGEKLLKGTSHF